MSLFALFFGLMSGCFLSVLVGIVGSKRRIGFGWAFLASCSSRRLSDCSSH